MEWRYGACGSIVDGGTMLQAGRSWFQILMGALHHSSLPNPSSLIVALGVTQLLAEMSTGIILGVTFMRCLSQATCYNNLQPGTRTNSHTVHYSMRLVSKPRLPLLGPEIFTATSGPSSLTGTWNFNFCYSCLCITVGTSLAVRSNNCVTILAFSRNTSCVCVCVRACVRVEILCPLLQGLKVACKCSTARGG
jgi:hypothetical protein